METIQFQNKEFRVREIEFPDMGFVLISTKSLNKLIMNENGGYVSDEASLIDESIFFFVEEEEIKSTNQELINLIISNIG